MFREEKDVLQSKWGFLDSLDYEGCSGVQGFKIQKCRLCLRTRDRGGSGQGLVAGAGGPAGDLEPPEFWLLGGGERGGLGKLGEEEVPGLLRGKRSELRVRRLLVTKREGEERG